MIRKICIVTGGRADYGLLRILMREIKKSRFFTLQLIVTGAHFSKEFGSTFREIQKDKQWIDARVDIGLSNDSSLAVGKAMGAGIKGISRAVARLRPDLLILLGDRYETFCAAAVATIFGVPIAHLHGGELTEGAYDDAFRHAITKMAYWHFVASSTYRKRVIQMGEQPARVFQVGALAVDHVTGQEPLSRRELEKVLKFRFQPKNLLITFHPPTLEAGKAGRQTEALLKALETFPKTGMIFTMPGADKECGPVWKKIRAFARLQPYAKAYRALGSRLYLSAMREVDAVVGNSSSGFLEAPVLKKPVVNIGSRQQGRMRTINILDCKPSALLIRRSIRKAISRSFRRRCRSLQHPYGKSGAARRILAVLNRLRRKPRSAKIFFNKS